MTKKTPLGTSLMILGLCSCLPFMILYALINYKNQIWQKGYQNLPEQGHQVFSTLTGFYKIQQQNREITVYTYLTPDRMGNKYEITEPVDQQTAARLRIGDTITTLSDEIQYFGSTRIISHIPGNSYPPLNHSFLENLFLFGIFFSMALLIIGLLLRFTGFLI